MSKVCLILILIGVSLMSCQTSGDESILCVNEGQHTFKPVSLNIGKYSSVAYEWTFEDNTQYVLCCGDQGDWLKLHGVSANLTTNHDNSFMCGFRYDTNGFWELAAYYHKNGEVVYPGKNDDVPFRVLPDSDGVFKFSTFINILEPNRDIVALTIIQGKRSYYYEVHFDKEFKVVRLINPYFGGNQTAPDRKCLQRSLINLE